MRRCDLFVSLAREPYALAICFSPTTNIASGAFPRQLALAVLCAQRLGMPNSRWLRKRFALRCDGRVNCDRAGELLALTSARRPSHWLGFVVSLCLMATKTLVGRFESSFYFSCVFPWLRFGGLACILFSRALVGRNCRLSAASPKYGIGSFRAGRSRVLGLSALRVNYKAPLELGQRNPNCPLRRRVVAIAFYFRTTVPGHAVIRAVYLFTVWAIFSSCSGAALFWGTPAVRVLIMYPPSACWGSFATSVNGLPNWTKHGDDKPKVSWQLAPG